MQLMVMHIRVSNECGLWGCHRWLSSVKEKCGAEGLCQVPDDDGDTEEDKEHEMEMSWIEPGQL